MTEPDEHVIASATVKIPAELLKGRTEEEVEAILQKAFDDEARKRGLTMGRLAERFFLEGTGDREPVGILFCDAAKPGDERTVVASTTIDLPASACREILVLGPGDLSYVQTREAMRQAV